MVVMAVLFVTNGVISRRLRMTVVDDADDLTSDGIAMRVTVVVDGRKTKGWFNWVDGGNSVGACTV